MTEKLHTVLVYGTLRPFTNEDVVKVRGCLYDLGWFPGIVLDDSADTEVVCERLSGITDEKLSGFDSYEGYYEENPAMSLYVRVKHGDDWIYAYNKDLSNRTVIESGDWEQHSKEFA